jgi:hypothetical protein
MSHIVTIQTQIRDQAAVAAACQRLGLAAPVHATARLFSTTATGLVVRLPGWKYPLVCDLAAGALHYDNYGGRWGNPAALQQFLQAYAVEITTLAARRKGHAVTEQPLADGSIKLTIQVAGGNV